MKTVTNVDKISIAEVYYYLDIHIDVLIFYINEKCKNTFIIRNCVIFDIIKFNKVFVCTITVFSL